MSSLETMGAGMGQRKVVFAFEDKEVETEMAREDIPDRGEKILWPDSDIEYVVSRVCRDFTAGLDTPPTYVLTMDPWSTDHLVEGK